MARASSLSSSRKGGASKFRTNRFDTALQLQNVQLREAILRVDKAYDLRQTRAKELLKGVDSLDAIDDGNAINKVSNFGCPRKKAEKGGETTSTK